MTVGDGIMLVFLVAFMVALVGGLWFFSHSPQRDETPIDVWRRSR